MHLTADVFVSLCRRRSSESLMKNGAILLAEDDANDSFLLKRAFEEVGLANPIVIVRDGEEAINYLKGVGTYSDRSHYPFPCLMLLDLKMPKLDGFDVLAWRKKQKHLQHLPIIVLSSSNQETDNKRAMDLGAVAYFVKPPDFQYLVEVVQQLRDRWLEPAKSGALCCGDGYSS